VRSWGWNLENGVECREQERLAFGFLRALELGVSWVFVVLRSRRRWKRHRAVGVR
jgi:hypothetical protein